MQENQKIERDIMKQDLEMKIAFKVKREAVSKVKEEPD